MRFTRYAVAILSILIFCLLLFAVVHIFLDQSTSTQELPAALALAGIVFLNLPQLFLVRFIKKTVPGGYLDLAIGLYLACFLALAVMHLAGGKTIDLAAIRVHDTTGLRTFVYSILGSSGLTIVLYFARALAMILVGTSLKRVALFDAHIRPFRILMLLTGIASLSIVAAPLSVVFLTFSYWSLGIFLLRTRLGAEQKPSFRIIDDYQPS
jgi:hypothetical protein